MLSSGPRIRTGAGVSGRLRDSRLRWDGRRSSGPGTSTVQRSAARRSRSEVGPQHPRRLKAVPPKSTTTSPPYSGKELVQRAETHSLAKANGGGMLRSGGRCEARDAGGGVRQLLGFSARRASAARRRPVSRASPPCSHHLAYRLSGISIGKLTARILESAGGAHVTNPW